MGTSPPRLDQALRVPGFRLGIASCGVKSAQEMGRRNDIMLLVSDVNCHAAGVFTQNRMRAACVSLGEATLQASADSIRAIVANSGNANAGTGEMEHAWAEGLIEAAAEAAGIDVTQTLSASTGVIGEPFPIERIRAGMGQAAASLSPDDWEQAADAIRTTDTFAKWASRRVGDHTITGICKGSGMIHPDMATMLGFIATDAPVSADQLKAMLNRAVGRSFNSISVDGDTSTNDTVYLLASGLGLGHPPLEDCRDFEAALTELCIQLAQLIVRDGEGVSKFVTIEVTGANSEAEARRVGRAIAVSPLVKTAFAGSDANWGRILMAIGNSGVDIDPDAITLKADDVAILAGGNLHPDYQNNDSMAVFTRDEFTLHVDLGMGASTATVWTGDLTHEYIRINAEYRT